MCESFEEVRLRVLEGFDQQFWKVCMRILECMRV